MTDIQRHANGLDRRELLKRSAIVGGTAWAVPVMQSLSAPAFGQVGSDPVPNVCGRMTGGGNNPGLGDVTHYGFELHCSSAVGPNNLTVSFLYKGKEVTFHLDTVTSVSCSDDPAVDPRPPDADFDTLIGTGTGHLTGPGAPGCAALDKARINFKFVDGGEGKGSGDFVVITVWCGAKKLLDVAGSPFGGNIQAHDATGKKNMC